MTSFSRHLFWAHWRRVSRMLVCNIGRGLGIEIRDAMEMQRGDEKIVRFWRSPLGASSDKRHRQEGATHRLPYTLHEPSRGSILTAFSEASFSRNGLCMLLTRACTTQGYLTSFISQGIAGIDAGTLQKHCVHHLMMACRTGCTAVAVSACGA